MSIWIDYNHIPNMPSKKMLNLLFKQPYSLSDRRMNENLILKFEHHPARSNATCVSKVAA